MSNESKPGRDEGKSAGQAGKKPDDRRANAAPDAVKDPNEKTEGKPGVPPGAQGTETDPGAG